MDVNEMDLIKRIKELNDLRDKKQICFIHGEDDVLIKSYHSQELYHAF